MAEQQTTNSGFDGLGIAPKLLEILDKNSFTTPTPIQKQAIPIAAEGKDLMGIAQTGTGKTLAFGIPILQRLAQNPGMRALIILPTRELGIQVNESLLKLGKAVGLKTAVLIGGEAINRQIRALKENPRIVVATPGRLIDHIQQRTISLANVGILVLDEADHMLNMGFAPQVNKILESVPANRQTMLFSATMPQEIVAIAAKYMKLPVRVEVAPQGTTAQRITQEVYFVNRDAKLQLLEKILTDFHGSVLVFSRTKHGAKKIARVVRNMGHTATEIHSNRSLNQRLEALSGFKVGKYRVLVATDIAARGIDVKGIELVINFDLPENPEDYVHRIGRTGRAGHVGFAISFATPDQKYDVRTIERLIKSEIKINPIPKTLPVGRPTTGPGFEDEDERRFERRGGFRAPRGGQSSGPRKFGNRSGNRDTVRAPRSTETAEERLSNFGKSRAPVSNQPFEKAPVKDFSRASRSTTPRNAHFKASGGKNDKRPKFMTGEERLKKTFYGNFRGGSSAKHKPASDNE